jgi:sulfur-oxidizing protein SoxY
MSEPRAIAALPIDRRLLLTGGAALALAGWLGLPQAHASAEDVAAKIDAFTGGIAPDTGKVVIAIEERIENGANVPVSVEIDGPTSGDDRVESVILLGEGNPFPVVATFHFSALSAAAVASTRVRLAQSQKLVAVAKFANGTYHMAERQVEVTVGGCAM